MKRTTGKRTIQNILNFVCLNRSTGKEEITSWGKCETRLPLMYRAAERDIKENGNIDMGNMITKVKGELSDKQASVKRGYEINNKYEHAHKVIMVFECTACECRPT